MLANHHKFEESRVWLDVGLDYNNSRKYIDIKATAQNIDYVRALPGIYAFTGCDYIPSFSRKGKIRPIKLMLKNEYFIDVFTRFGEEELTEDDYAMIEEFTCSMFGYGKLKSINEARFAYFQIKCKPKSSEKPLDCIKSVDPSMFPPCRSVLEQQIKCGWFVTKLYKNSTVSEPLQGICVLDHGYYLVDGRIQVKWFEGEQVPTLVEEEDEEDEEMGEGEEGDEGETDYDDDDDEEEEEDISDIDDSDKDE